MKEDEIFRTALAEEQQHLHHGQRGDVIRPAAAVALLGLLSATSKLQELFERQPRGAYASRDGAAVGEPWLLDAVDDPAHHVRGLCAAGGGAVRQVFQGVRAVRRQVHDIAGKAFPWGGRAAATNPWG